jgi:hypothetical protein
MSKGSPQVAAAPQPTQPTSSDTPALKKWWNGLASGWRWLIYLLGIVTTLGTLITFSPSLQEVVKERFPALTLERTGYLIPRDKGTSLPGCVAYQRQYPDGRGVAVLIGNNVVLISDKGTKIPALTINNKHVVELEYAKDGSIGVWADVVTPEGRTVAGITGGTDWTADKQIATVLRSNSHIVVEGPSGEELFFARYTNSKTFELRGRFFAPGPFGSLTVTSQGVAIPEIENLVGGGCFINRGIQVTRGRWQF